MFSRVAAIALLASAMFAVASPVPNGGGDTNICSTGPVQCCNSVQSISISQFLPGIAGLLGLLGVVVGPITGQVGVTCNPISVLGLGGNSCTAQTVCCENNSFNGVVALGCNNISLL
ncbi:hydrophobin-251 [Marasmius fiardii PR-910]|nr:hydrophobin-251 [Marasmius fiardii PR-910]